MRYLAVLDRARRGYLGFPLSKKRRSILKGARWKSSFECVFSRGVLYLKQQIITSICDILTKYCNTKILIWYYVSHAILNSCRTISSSDGYSSHSHLFQECFQIVRYLPWRCCRCWNLVARHRWCHYETACQ